MHCSLYHRAANPCYAHASKTCFIPCSRFRAGNESGFCCYYPCSWHFACCSLAWESPASKRVSRSTATAYSIRCRQTYIQEFQIISPKRFFHPANRPNPAKAGNPGANSHFHFRSQHGNPGTAHPARLLAKTGPGNSELPRCRRCFPPQRGFRALLHRLHREIRRTGPVHTHRSDLLCRRAESAYGSRRQQAGKQTGNRHRTRYEPVFAPAGHRSRTDTGRQ